MDKTTKLTFDNLLECSHLELRGVTPCEVPFEHLQTISSDVAASKVDIPLPASICYGVCSTEAVSCIERHIVEIDGVI